MKIYLWGLLSVGFGSRVGLFWDFSFVYYELGDFA